MAAGKAAHHAQPARLRQPRPARLKTGFTLVEIAVVLGIIALIVGALLPLIATQSANSRLSATRQRQQGVRAALVYYVGQHGYLPCPADPGALPGTAGYGHEARASAATGVGACSLTSVGGLALSHSTSLASLNPVLGQQTVLHGVVPWLDLGLPEDAANDGWLWRLSYVVVDTATQPYAVREAGSGLLGGLLVCNGLGAGSTLVAPAIAGSTACSDPASAQPVPGVLSPVLALISHGENGYGAFIPPAGPVAPAGGLVRPYAGLASPAETANIDMANRVLVQAPYSRSNDDIVLWQTGADLTGPLIQAGSLPSTQQAAQQKFSQVKAQVLSAMVSQRSRITDPNTCQIAYAYTLASTTPCAGAGLLCQGPVASPVALTAANLPAGTLAATALSWTFSLDLNASGAAGINAVPRVADDATRISFDPWGNPILFSLMGAASLTFSATEPATSSAHPYAYLLYSAGPDGLVGTADDLSLLVNSSEMQAALTSYGPLAASSNPGANNCGGGPNGPGQGGPGF